MMVVIAYDIDTTTAEGRRRLHRVAKLCESAGSRVQDSVFEMNTDPKGLDTFLCLLGETIDPKQDTARVYRLGDNCTGRINVIGKAAFNPFGNLIAV